MHGFSVTGSSAPLLHIQDHVDGLVHTPVPVMHASLDHPRLARGHSPSIPPFSEGCFIQSHPECPPFGFSRGGGDLPCSPEHSLNSFPSEKLLANRLLNSLETSDAIVHPSSPFSATYPFQISDEYGAIFPPIFHVSQRRALALSGGGLHPSESPVVTISREHGDGDGVSTSEYAHTSEFERWKIGVSDTHFRKEDGKRAGKRIGNGELTHEWLEHRSLH